MEEAVGDVRVHVQQVEGRVAEQCWLGAEFEFFGCQAGAEGRATGRGTTVHADDLATGDRVVVGEWAAPNGGTMNGRSDYDRLGCGVQLGYAINLRNSSVTPSPGGSRMTPLILAAALAAVSPAQPADPFAADNLVAWCIVPFDKANRGPTERAELLAKLGFKRFAYDWRAQHLPTFDAEVQELKKRNIELSAVWFPANLGPDAQALLGVIRKHGIKTQLWVTMGDPPGADRQAKVESVAKVIRPIAEEAAKIGCTVGLYNHGGWFGEPENQIAVIDHLKLSNVGIVYNLHHGHDHLDRFPKLLALMKPHLYALNLNGMVTAGDKVGKKILVLGQGDHDLIILKTIRDSGYRGPIGILGHTNDDAEARLRDNLDGLTWLKAKLDGKEPGPKPKPRTP
jgi:sugar phosphate isomerase/epimerase